MSAEIIIIALGVVKDYDTMVKILVLFAIGVGMTVLVYGLVAILVKLDDFGAYLVRQGKAKLGNALLWFMPWFMRGLSVVGTLAMFFWWAAAFCA